MTSGDIDGREARHTWATKPMREVFDAILSLETRAEVESFFRDLCTMSELEAMAHRWEVARLLEQGLAVPGDRREDARLDDDRDARGALAEARRRRLQAGARPQEGRTQLLKVAVPVKGRLREPSFKLLEDAGLGPEQPGERALAFPCRNAPVEVLLVRAADIPEYVQDGVVDCGITGSTCPRARRPGQRSPQARVRLVPPRGSRARRVGVPAVRGSRGALGRDGLSAPDAAAVPGRRSSSSTSPGRLRSRRGWVWPTRSSTSSRRGTHCSRTACARSACCSSPRPC